ncbi:MAG TPA: hypothetical protein VJZ26_05885 [Blastocatellia bacterium]|nr:hypothetical protein [Blastocatellia bacterium]
MKAKHHFWTSLATGGALYWATGSSAALAGSMLGGFFIDGDHIFDQLWSIRKGAPDTNDRKRGARGWASRYLRRRKLLRLPLIFHSFELLAALIALTVYFRTPFLIGFAIGYALHLALDLARHHHEFRSPFFYLLLYRLSQRFRRDRLIKPEYF